MSFFHTGPPEQPEGGSVPSERGSAKLRAASVICTWEPNKVRWLLRNSSSTQVPWLPGMEEGGHGLFQEREDFLLQCWLLY